LWSTFRWVRPEERREAEMEPSPDLDDVFAFILGVVIE
jgi:hypothetical protein